MCCHVCTLTPVMRLSPACLQASQCDSLDDIRSFWGISIFLPAPGRCCNSQECAAGNASWGSVSSTRCVPWREQFCLQDLLGSMRAAALKQESLKAPSKPWMAMPMRPCSKKCDCAVGVLRVIRGAAGAGLPPGFGQPDDSLAGMVRAGLHAQSPLLPLPNQTTVARRHVHLQTPPTRADHGRRGTGGGADGHVGDSRSTPRAGHLPRAAAVAPRHAAALRSGSSERLVRAAAPVCCNVPCRPSSRCRGVAGGGARRRVHGRPRGASRRRASSEGACWVGGQACLLCMVSVMHATPAPSPAPPQPRASRVSRSW